MNYTQEQTKYCIECGKEFIAESYRNKYCSDGCRKAASKRQVRDSQKRLKSGIYTRFMEKDLERPPEILKPTFVKWEKVIVCQSGKELRRARVVECYDNFVLCHLKNYRECFMHNQINKDKEDRT